MKIILIIFLFFFISIDLAYGALYEQEIPITHGDIGLDTIVFDGKWTFRTEWKQSTLTEIRYDDGHEMVIRMSHDYENIFVHVNFVTYTPVVNFNDKATICFNSDKQQIDKPNSNTFCFVQIMGKDNTYILQGGEKLASTGFYKIIKNDLGVIGVGNISDENDRYSSIPHESYEFKIPIDLIGRSNLYGFYVNVYVDKANKEYTWPKDVTSDRYPFIPKPNTWGTVVSLDNSIPEFPIPLYILVMTLLTVTVFSKIKFQKIFQYR